ncbi:MAG: hypothetical protein H6974_03050 [Gammaproteobacteria bacterium]|nr:hypothetical protein [Gammaproteobacteria bacterium]MCP5195759.1 hypothetical protein [Gammaproteobacteria bacterium]
MKKFEILAIGLAIAIVAGCTGGYMADDQKPTEPNMTADLKLGESADSILEKYGKPIYKKGRIDSEGKQVEDWFYKNAMLSFKDSNLTSFKPK